MDVPVQKKAWNECFIIGHWCDSCHILFGGWKLFWVIEPHIPYLLGGAFVLWVIYANLFIKSKKLERKKTLMEKIDDWVEEQNKYDEKITEEYENALWQQEINRQNGHYY